MKTVIDTENVYKQCEDCLLEDMDGEILLYNPANATTLHLNDSSLLIYQLCTGENSLKTIVDNLLEAYPEQAEQIKGDVLNTIDDLVSSLSIELVESRVMANWLIERAGVALTVKAKPGVANDLIQAALESMQPKKISKSKGILLSVEYVDGSWLLRDECVDLEHKLNLPGDLIYHLTDRIVFHIADKSKRLHCLHAGAVSRHGHGIVIPASSGSGKSSFTCWLVANGFDYLTDELILLNKQHEISGIGRPIQIKPHGIDAITPLLTKPELVYKGNIANAVPVQAFDGVHSEEKSHKLSIMVFPCYKKTAGFEFEKLSSAQAGMSLMANHVNARNLQGHGFREIMAIIRKTPCYSLTYGGFDHLPHGFAEQLNIICSDQSKEISS